MRAVEGIKNEVDRQRRYGRTAVIIALLAGLIVGALAMSLAYLYPVNPSKINDSIISDIRMFMDIYKNLQYDVDFVMKLWYIKHTDC